MNKVEVSKAIEQGFTVCHVTSKQVVKETTKGILYSHDHKTGLPYELKSSDFEDCFIKAVNHA